MSVFRTYLEEAKLIGCFVRAYDECSDISNVDVFTRDGNGKVGIALNIADLL